MELQQNTRRERLRTRHTDGIRTSSGSRPWVCTPQIPRSVSKSCQIGNKHHKHFEKCVKVFFLI